jgi:hypothetical protein
LFNQISFNQSLRKMNKSEWMNILRYILLYIFLRIWDFMCFCLLDFILLWFGHFISPLISWEDDIHMLSLHERWWTKGVFCWHEGRCCHCTTWVSNIFPWVMRRSIFEFISLICSITCLLAILWNCINFCCPCIIFLSFALNLTFVEYFGQIIIAWIPELDDSD